MEYVIGIVRISTKKQNTDRQERNILERYPNAKIVKLIVSGSDVIGLEAFDKLIEKIKADKKTKYKLVWDSASRLSRNAEKGCELYEDLFNSNITLEFLKEPYINSEVFRTALDKKIKANISTGATSTDNLVNAVIEALNQFTRDLAKEQVKKVFEQAEKEVEDLRERTKEGLVTAKLEGKQIGRKEGTTFITSKEIKAKEMIRKHHILFEGNLNDKELIKIISAGKTAFYKYKKEMLEGV